MYVARDHKPVKVFRPRSLEPSGFRAWLDNKGYRLAYSGMTITAIPLEDNPKRSTLMVHQRPGQPVQQALKQLKKHIEGK